MPWEKSFDEDDVVGKAMTVFWQKGYDSTSLADLISSTGITRGSLYNAFGGKEPLFVLALQKYDTDHRRAWLAELEAIDDPARAIALLFDHLVADTVQDAGQKGCFLVNTSLDLASHGAEVNQLVRQGLREFQAFFRRCVEVGQARQQFPGTLEPQATAQGLMGMVVAIRVLGRGTFDAAALHTLAAQAQRLLH